MSATEKGDSSTLNPRTLLSPETERWVRERQARITAIADERRAEWNRDTVPDLEFSTPDCPICGLPTECDDGFYCDPCGAAWRINGTGGQRG